MQYFETEVATCGKCGHVLIKQYPQILSMSSYCSPKWFCLKCNTMVNDVVYTRKTNNQKF